MKKSGLIFLIIIAVLLVSGQGCERKEARGEGVFIGGKSGLDVEFIEDAPPTSGNFKDEALPIEIRLTNKGETDIGRGSAKIYLTGALYSSAAVSATKKEGSNDDIIVAIEEGAGGIIEDSILVDMGEATYTGTIFGDSVPLDVSAAVCYPYETRIQVNDFCVPSTVKRAISEDECSIDASENIIVESDNSAGPIQITSLREDKGLDYIRVTLDINNVGTGEIVNLCKRDIERGEMNEVSVSMPSNFKCSFKGGESNTGKIELRSGHAALRCRRDVNNPGSAYKEPLIATLNYNYRQDLSKTITINKE